MSPSIPAQALSELNPLPRLLMGPGPINADPRVLRAMSAQLLGQFDPQFRQYMRDTQALYRGVFETSNAQTLCIDGTARSAIELDCGTYGRGRAGTRPLINRDIM